jgi:hypothetical protein
MFGMQKIIGAPRTGKQPRGVYHLKPYVKQLGSLGGDQQITSRRRAGNDNLSTHVAAARTA